MIRAMFTPTRALTRGLRTTAVRFVGSERPIVDAFTEPHLQELWSVS
jgi:hypothetical protein